MQNSNSTLPSAATARLLRRYIPAATGRLCEIARNLSLRKSISTLSYERIPVAKEFWRSGDSSNRSWLFALHSFAPLDALMATEDWRSANLLVEEWAEMFGASGKKARTEFPWHDHATALRLDRLSVMCLSGRGGVHARLASMHAETLLREDFYTKHTNHGFDQALALLLASAAFAPHVPTTTWRTKALERLLSEIRFGFTEDGVHVENSPAYHVGMVANLARARLVLDCVDEALDIDFDSLLEKALRFSAWITGPDRMPVLLGDSTIRSSMPPEELSYLPSYDLAIYAATGGAQGRPTDAQSNVFPSAGYAVYRSSWNPWENHVHFVMKCGHLSSFHRHDDDLNVLLQGYGEHWLIDSGLYSHNQKDPVRVYMRSAMAHNVPIISGSQSSRSAPPADKRPSLKQTSLAGDPIQFTGTTNMQSGARIRRSVTIESPDRFQISDTLLSLRGQPNFYVLFHVPSNKSIRLFPQGARVIGRAKELRIRCATGNAAASKVHSGLDGLFKSARSLKLNHLEPTQLIAFGPVQGGSVRIRLDFVPRR
jgi:hypothetical protein